MTIEPSEIVILDPEERDSVGDVLDESDRCPDSPEDVDGLSDDDGCPEPAYPRFETREGVTWEINQHVVDGRNIITESSIIIF